MEKNTVCLELNIYNEMIHTIRSLRDEIDSLNDMIDNMVVLPKEAFLAKKEYSFQDELKFFIKSEYAIDVFKEILGEDYDVYVKNKDTKELIVGLGDIEAFKKEE